MRVDIADEEDITIFEGEKLNDKVNGHAAAASMFKPERSAWPAPMSNDAYHGIVGRIVRAIEPHTEVDPAALLLQLLAASGNVIGRSSYWEVEADKHHCNQFVVIVGPTAKGRKGTSFGHVKRLFRAVDDEWAGHRIMDGLASGEGLVWHVRDPIQEPQLLKEKGKVTGTEMVEVHPGVSDKRLLVSEPEFARVLQVCERDTNTLSAIIRQAWDSGDLRVLTKKQAAQSTGAHISIIAHVTSDELKRLLSDTAVANGFANRFLFCCTKRSKLLPEGGDISGIDWAPMVRELNRAVKFGRTAGLVKRDAAARLLWIAEYPRLSDGHPGMFGAVTARAEAQVMRLACIYALLDCSDVITVDHLRAGLEVWRYCEDSARCIFGDSLGDATADAILEALRGKPEGMSRTDLRDLFGRHKSTAEMGRALSVLKAAGLARSVSSSTDGRPSERWYVA
jgi:hypothetical protein